MQVRKTYEGWLASGRAVSKGSKAEFYLVSPDGTQCRPLFDIEQTMEHETVDGAWSTVVPAADRPRMGKPKDTRPKLKMSYSDGTMRVWCGPNKEAIANLKKRGFKFDKYSHRWHGERTEEKFQAAVSAYEDWGYSVEVES